MTWFLMCHGATVIKNNVCYLISCKPELSLLTLVEILVWSVIICLTTIAFPAAFIISNFRKGWYISALCGCCGFCLEITLLCTLRAKDPIWYYCTWIALGGLIGCTKLAACLIL